MLTVVIQAGGESRRMGKDKALMPFLGQPMIARLIERVRPIAEEILVTTNQPEAYEFLGVPLAADVLPGSGALGGLYTALQAASQPLVAVVACDMPFASQELLAFQRDLLVHESVDVVLPATEQGMEPLHAVYRRDTCLPAVEAALQHGQRRMIAWFEHVKVRVLSEDEIAPFDPGRRAFMNVNTPEELLEAENLARMAED
jgi:molybdopterin-guanine dinucleotide biosynthesis protein A